MTLNRNPINFFAEVEQIAFCPANLVPGIEPSPDLLLAGRLFSYSDTQRYRLGANFHLLPVNKAHNRVMAPTQRDGPMRSDDNMGPQPNYYPNSFSDVRDDPKMLESNFTVNGNGGNGVNDHVVVYRYDDKNDHNYEQARDQYNSYSKEWKERLHRNLATAMNGVHAFIRDRTLEELRKVDPLYSNGVRTEINRLAKKLAN
ncbi:unnamed protein product [Oppiella nova]|uniref:Catalase core domain-containing protein n=1 Tax=Oppiella nova TaxID=334625 RepID=A0A7R9R0Q3_9ACAR|nr:unnamed protein product [Oppiella nova]CAG2181460.1 unnamed protein product [Oppiella nova]